MSEQVKTEAEVTEENLPVQESSVLDDVFKERAGSRKAKTEEEKAPQAKPEKKEEPKTDAKKVEPKKAIPSIDEGDEDDDEPSETELIKRDFEKTKKALSETKKWAHTNSQKLKTAIKKINSLVDSEILTEAEAKELTEQLNAEGDEEHQYEASDNLPPMQKIYSSANRELENIKKYTDDENLTDKIAAFDFFITDCDPDEREEILDELESLRGSDPLKMTKRMISLGAKYYEEVYKEFKEAGGYKKYSAQKNDEIVKLQKKVDKLTRKLSQYEEYDDPTRRIAELTDTDGAKGVEQATKDTLSQMFEERKRIPKA
jgi:hypothetical protein